MQRTTESTSWGQTQKSSQVLSQWRREDSSLRCQGIRGLHATPRQRPSCQLPITHGVRQDHGQKHPTVLGVQRSLVRYKLFISDPWPRLKLMQTRLSPNPRRHAKETANTLSLPMAAKKAVVKANIYS